MEPPFGKAFPPKRSEPTLQTRLQGRRLDGQLPARPGVLWRRHFRARRATDRPLLAHSPEAFSTNFTDCAPDRDRLASARRAGRLQRAARAPARDPGGQLSPGASRRPDRGEDLAQAIDVRRLDQVVVEAGLARPPLVVLLSPAGQGDQQRRRGGRRLARILPRDLVAVHPRHADVQQHGVGLEGRRGASSASRPLWTTETVAPSAASSAPSVSAASRLSSTTRMRRGGSGPAALDSAAGRRQRRRRPAARRRTRCPRRAHRCAPRPGRRAARPGCAPASARCRGRPGRGGSSGRPA